MGELYCRKYDHSQKFSIDLKKAKRKDKRNMKKILFVCHGNICRSPMAQCIMQKLVDDKGLTGEYEIDSAATSNEEIGQPIYPYALSALKEHGIPVIQHRARRFRSDEYEYWDHIIVMDDYNLRNILRICKDPEGKIRKLRANNVEDPWYSRDFMTAFNDIYAGCLDLFERLEAE